MSLSTGIILHKKNKMPTHLYYKLNHTIILKQLCTVHHCSIMQSVQQNLSVQLQTVYTKTIKQFLQ